MPCKSVLCCKILCIQNCQNNELNNIMIVKQLTNCTSFNTLFKMYMKQWNYCKKCLHHNHDTVCTEYMYIQSLESGYHIQSLKTVTSGYHVQSLESVTNGYHISLASSVAGTPSPFAFALLHTSFSSSSINS